MSAISVGAGTTSTITSRTGQREGITVELLAALILPTVVGDGELAERVG
jgi:hypothetical protein